MYFHLGKIEQSKIYSVDKELHVSDFFELKTNRLPLVIFVY